jgi:hypothetical protein
VGKILKRLICRVPHDCFTCISIDHKMPGISFDFRQQALEPSLHSPAVSVMGAPTLTLGVDF